MSNTSASSTNRLKRLTLKTLQVLAITLLILYVAIWVFTPPVVRHFANQSLQPYDLSLTQSSSVRYNPFLSQLTVENLALQKTASSRQVFGLDQAIIEIHLHRLLFETLHIDQFHLDGLSIDIHQAADTLEIAGFNLAELQAEEASQDVENTPQTEQPLNYQISGQALQISNASITLAIDGKQHRLKLNSFTISDLSASQGNLSLATQLRSSIDGASLSLDSSISLQANNGTINTRVALDNYPLAKLQAYAADSVAELTGEVSFSNRHTLTLQGDQIDIKAPQTEIVLDELAAITNGMALSLDKQVIELSDVLAELSQGALTSLSGSGQLSIDQGLITPSQSDDILAQWQQVNIAEFSLQPGQENSPFAVENLGLYIDSLQIEKLITSQPVSDGAAPPALAEIAEISVGDITLNQQSAKIDTLILAGLSTNITINEQKAIDNLVALSSTSEADQPETSPAEADATSTEQTDTASANFQVVLNEFSIQDNATVAFKDHSVTPHYERTFTFDELSLRGLDSSSDTPADFVITGSSNEYAKLDLSGTINPFTEHVNLSIDGTISEVALPAVSSYIKESLGFELLSGQLDSELKVVVNESNLDGTVGLHLRGLNMTRSTSGTDNVIQEQTAVPLNVALGMLQDKQGNVKLNLPMSGSIDDPSFGISSFMVLIAKKAVISQAKSYLLNTFVPYANVVSVAMTAGEFVMKVRFEDMIYDHTTVELNAANLEYMQEFIALMKSKSKTQVKICGIAVAEDIGLAAGSQTEDEAQLATLRDIAKQRGEIFKQYAVTQGELESARLLLCNPQIDFSENALPRIEISI